MAKAPGFRVPRTVFRLQFEDEQFDGLEIRARSMPLGRFFELQELQAQATKDTDAARKVIGQLAEAINEWNLEDEAGNPVKPTEDAMGELEIGFVMAIMDAWMEAIASVPNHSRAASNGGETSLEPSIPMDVSSPSPGS